MMAWVISSRPRGGTAQLRPAPGGLDWPEQHLLARRSLLWWVIWTLVQTAIFKLLLDQIRDVLARESLGVQQKQNDLFTLVALFVMICLSEWLVTLVHEGGHFLMDCLLGFEFQFLQVGPLKIVRARDGIRLRLDVSRGAGGATAAYPLSDRSLRLRWVLVVAAGPLASVLLGIISWRLLVNYLAPCQTGGAPSDTYLSSFTGNADPLCLAIAISGGSALNPFVIGLLMLLVWGAIIGGLFNLLLPYSGVHGVGDGLRLLRLLMGGKSAERDLIALQLAGYAAFAVRPREWPAQLVLRRVALAETQRDQYVAALFAYNWALDSSYIERAGKFLDQLQVTAPAGAPRASTILALESAYFEARHRANSMSAREWLRRGSKREDSQESQAAPILRPRAQAALLLLEGRCQEAAARANEALDALGQRLLADATLPEQWMQEEEEQLRQMLAEAQQMQQREES